MPELPEVETIRRGLLPVMEGAVIARLTLRRAGLRWPFPAAMAETVSGARVLLLRRRAKYILADLDNRHTLLFHMGMSGRILIEGASPDARAHDRAAPTRHDHALFDMHNGARITFNDARRFGMLDLFATGAEAAQPLLAKLGPEPLGNDLNAAALADRFAGRKSPIKTALLDQRIIAGLGNIYVSEALWRAQIHPETPIGALGLAQIETLIRQIRDVLDEAIAAGGSSLRDYRQTDGELGYFQHGFAVYDRAEHPCARPGCAGQIARITQAGRSSYFCPLCQPKG
ncbi:bifunctional DNA-formamidopyrimidine glycosylase/DNA-(apurinic or apyrimidinic site) lyase [Abyssibius alkaniclasticus]|uniref:bifunctional DNA-formamidopyrimidine glycosylase/DNA-(apurinic or apyrimidinic site) lyase n=1 Tax=Abyssibius alkaniclasticus TaxID=2881234 RepID=UPI00236356A3|nr:bifunctional DNA-formamidopyrimidine glycosylase/DNA-(apurinic or apyrimidinic site) lyase [Abyssibius alkaniclasticus]UPH71975.1 bifunctional DNA-formamidopyrimidine glycosylase/DNA-(apurinic or apyrimidinic site) lyase [Abyssibius alkaniclasticus]